MEKPQKIPRMIKPKNVQKKSKKALFLDRDGVINEDLHYVHTSSKFVFKNEIFPLCRKAIQNDYLLVVVTNQSGIGRGLYTEEEFHKLTLWMNRKFQEQKVLISDVLFSASHPTHGIGRYKKEDYNRKPNPGMILEASEKHNISTEKSILIGDKISDIQAGIAAGVGKNILLAEGENEGMKISGRDSFFIINNLQSAENYL